MKELKIKIPKGYEIDKEKSTFEKIIFKKIKTELPKTWEEFCEQNPITNTEFYINSCSGISNREDSLRNKVADKTLLSTKEDAEAYIALIQLHRLRDVYRQGWKPKWNDNNEKYCITYYECKVEICALCISQHLVGTTDECDEYYKTW